MAGRVVIINGYPRSGKDTFAETCKVLYPKNVEITSTVGPIKEAATVLGWDGSKTDKNREFLHELKMLWSKFLDGSFNHICSVVAKNPNKVVFVMAREVPEIKRFKEHFNSTGDGCVTLLVQREGLHKPDNYADSYVQYDTDGSYYPYDYTFTNGNVSDWADKMIIGAEHFMKSMTPIDVLQNPNSYEFETLEEITEFLKELDSDYEKLLLEVVKHG